MLSRRCDAYSFALTRSRERGQVFIILIVIIALGAATAFFTFYSPASLTNRADQINTAVLAQARDALIGRAASNADRPGSLPCPDTNNDGLENWDVSATFCASNIGRLPWATLGLPDLRDASGERLWYALSPNFRDHASIQPLNSDTAGQFTITGVSPASTLITILFAPGAIVGSQLRSAANVNDVAQYLEGENNNGDMIFNTAHASDTFNDRLLAITSEALFYVVAVRVAKDVRLALDQYRTDNGYYPDANDYADGSPYYCKVGQTDGRIPLSIQAGCPTLVEWTTQLPSWFGANNWNLLTHYGLDNTCGLTVTGHTTTGCAVVIVTGRALAAQSRPCANAANCLEDVENTNGNSVYVKPSKYPTSNDRMAVLCLAASPCSAVP